MKHIKLFENYDFDTSHRDDNIGNLYNYSEFEKEELEDMSDIELAELWNDMEIDNHEEELEREEEMYQLQENFFERDQVINLIRNCSDHTEEELSQKSDDELMKLWDEYELDEWISEL